jgi:hypothetical protein
MALLTSDRPNPNLAVLGVHMACPSCDGATVREGYIWHMALTNLLIALPRDIVEDLNRLSKANGCGRTEYIRTLLIEHCAAQRKKTATKTAAKTRPQAAPLKETVARKILKRPAKPPINKMSAEEEEIALMYGL